MVVMEASEVTGMKEVSWKNRLIPLAANRVLSGKASTWSVIDVVQQKSTTPTLGRVKGVVA